MQAIIAYLVGLFIITPLIINITGLVFAKIAAEEASRTLLVIGAGIGAGQLPDPETLVRHHGHQLSVVRLPDLHDTRHPE